MLAAEQGTADRRLRRETLSEFAFTRDLPGLHCSTSLDPVPTRLLDLRDSLQRSQVLRQDGVPPRPTRLSRR